MIIRGPLAIVFAIVLLLSVATNLLIAGFVVARLHGPPPGGDEIERIVMMGIRAFPPELQKAIVASAHAKDDEMKTKIDTVKQARQKIFDAMRAEPFDRAALEAAYADLRTSTGALQQVGQELTLDALASAPADLRQRIRPPHGPFP
ncbi:MAG TPA: periplasmic heavy metal sensor [Bauldia sp.]